MNALERFEEEKMGFRHIPKSLMLLVVALFFVSFNGFNSSDGGIRINYCSPALAKNKNSGPPDHAKAHGYRAKHTYRYYPSAQAYYDVDRKAYFYLEGGNWQVSVSLPISLKLQLGDCVTIEMDSDKPYTRFEEHRRSYPPGQAKKNKHKKKT
jgi:hypothetical protein